MKYLPAILLFLISFACRADEAGMRLRYERTDAAYGLLHGAGTCFGVDLSEFGIPGDQWVMTAAHNVVTNEVPHDKIEIEIEGEWVPCSIVIYDKDTDICVLRSGKPPKKILKMAKYDVAWGAALSMSASIAGAPVRTYEGKLVRHFWQGSSRSLATIQFGHGASGAPILDEFGRLAGIALAGIPLEGDIDPSQGLFFPISSIKALIRTYIYRAAFVLP